MKKAKNLRPVEKWARTGSAEVVSGVDANVFGLESRFCERAAVGGGAGETKALLTTTASEVFYNDHR